MARTLRTFLAIELPRGVRRKVAKLIEQLAASPAKVKWVDESNLHLTLQVLGEVEPDLLPEICGVVEQATADLAGYELEIAGVGAFPTAERPRTVWVGSGEGSEATVAVHDAIGEALAELGFRTEQRRFRPHVTIGRVRRSSADEIARLAEDLAETADFVAGWMPVSEVVLFSSLLGREGPTYDVLARSALG